MTTTITITVIITMAITLTTMFTMPDYISLPVIRKK